MSTRASLARTISLDRLTPPAVGMQPPTFTSKAISKYFRTRILSLFVPRSEMALYLWSDIYNPFKLLSELTAKNWGYFILAFFMWALDALDYFSVSLNLSLMAEDLHKTTTEMSWSITLVLMFRSVGAFIFGLWGDRYGRRWPLMVNLAVLCVIQIGTGFVKDFKSFLGVRALFGCSMGGLYGNSAALALDDCPQRARGVVSGIFQQGYAFGYLLAVIFTRAIVDNSPHTWRALFWFSSGPPVLMIICLLFMSETEVSTKNLARIKTKLDAAVGQRKLFALSDDTKGAVKRYWLIIIYLILLMSGMNFSSHGSQDLYPTMLTKELHFSDNASTVTNSVANLGAMAGGFSCGHLSTFLGRRLTLMLTCVFGAAMIYPWAYLRSTAINAGAFFLQFAVQGGWGVIPIHLSELSPPMYRSFVTGLSYQLGNLCSSASSTIEATIGERFPVDKAKGIYNYSKVMAIFMGSVFTFLFFMALIGPENRNAVMSGDRDDSIEEEFSDEGSRDSHDELHNEKNEALHLEVALKTV